MHMVGRTTYNIIMHYIDIGIDTDIDIGKISIDITSVGLALTRHN